MITKDFYKVSFSLLSFLIAFFITIYAHNDNNILLFLVPILITGMFIPVTIAIFKDGNFKANFIKSLKYSFLISSLIYISGYVFFALQPLFY